MKMCNTSAMEGSSTSKKKKELVDVEPGNVSKQPTLTIGVVGDVANGKSTLVKALTGKATQQHSSERSEHGKTIRLGFANGRFHQCPECTLCFPTQDMDSHTGSENC